LRVLRHVVERIRTRAPHSRNTPARKCLGESLSPDASKHPLPAREHGRNRRGTAGPQKSLFRLFFGQPNLKSNIKKLKSLEYSVIGKKIVYSDFGAPIRRHRFIAFGSRNGNAEIFFKKLLEQQ